MVLKEMFMKYLAVLILILSLAAGGCSKYAAGALALAGIVGTAYILYEHDGHYHDDDCGHVRRHHEGRWVYHYEDRWEYYDEEEDEWYAYSE